MNPGGSSISLTYIAAEKNHSMMAGLLAASSVPPALKHVAVFAFPFTSHPFSLLALTRHLAAASPPATTFSFFSTEASNAALFSACSSSSIDTRTSLNKIRFFDVHDGLPEGFIPTTDPDGAVVSVEPLELFMRVAPGSFRRAVAAAEEAAGRRVSSVVSDAFLWFVADLASEKSVPWVPVWMCGPRSLMAHVEVDLIRSTITNTIGCEDNVLDFVPGFSRTKCRDLPDGIALGNFHSTLAELLHTMGHTLHRAIAVVVNSSEEADPVVTKHLHSKFQKYLNVGPFVLASPLVPTSFSDPNDCIPWLDHHEPNSVAYISFGTLVKPEPDELMALMETLLETRYPFLWSYRGNLMTDHNFPKEFVEKVIERGKIVPWAPQLAVLGHGSVGVFVTHCGWNSLVESIAGGVPMIGRPFFGDQPLNRSTMEDEWKIGIEVEGGVFTKEGTMRALELVLSQGEGKKMRERVGVLKEALLKSMEPNGTSARNFKSLLEIVNS